MDDHATIFSRSELDAMTIFPPEAKDAVARWSEVNRQFLEFVERNPELRERASFESLFRDNPIKRLPPQPWPLFVDEEPNRRIGEAVVALDKLFKSVIPRFFANDPRLVFEFYKIANPMLIELLLAPPNGIAGAMSRTDFINTPEGMRCLEYNAGSLVGGWHMQVLEDAYFRTPVLARFLGEHGVRARHRNTIRLLFRHLIRETIASGVWKGGDLNLGLVIRPQEPARIAMHTASEAVYKREYRAALEEERPGLTGELYLCAHADMTEAGGGLSFQGARVHTILEQHNADLDQRSFRHAKGGKVQLFTGPATVLLSDKRNLVLLSENAEGDRFSAAERDLIRTYIPWTRLVARTQTVFRDESVSLPDLLSSRREDLVLKKAQGLGGRGVHVGRYTPQSEWEEIATKALDEGGWIVQEYVESIPYYFLAGDGNAVLHNLVFGLFTFGDTFGGALLRLQPRGGRGVVNTAGGAEIDLLFEVES